MFPLDKMIKNFDNKEAIILRDYLALERTRLANERTLLSYIRTALYLILGGITILTIDSFEPIRWLGYISLGLSIFLIMFGTLRYFILRRKINTHYFQKREETNQS
jgi:putative membrane protein